MMYLEDSLHFMPQSLHQLSWEKLAPAYPFASEGDFLVETELFNLMMRFFWYGLVLL